MIIAMTSVSFGQRDRLKDLVTPQEKNNLYHMKTQEISIFLIAISGL